MNYLLKQLSFVDISGEGLAGTRGWFERIVVYHSDEDQNQVFDHLRKHRWREKRRDCFQSGTGNSPAVVVI